MTPQLIFPLEGLPWCSGTLLRVSLETYYQALGPHGESLALLLLGAALMACSLLLRRLRPSAGNGLPLHGSAAHAAEPLARG
jgi:hypothetical protein